LLQGKTGVVLYSNYLQILPTSRAIRNKKSNLANADTFLPKMVTIADFESRVIVSKGKLVDSLQRTLFLKEASDFNGFEDLKADRNLVKFYSQADDFFSFFQEVAQEGVKISDLYLADSYAEFDRDLELLQKLLDNYEQTINHKGFNDKIFLPKNYKLNKEYIDSFDGFYLELDGFLTKFEINLFFEIAQLKPFVISFRTTSFNKKMQKIFIEYGVDLKNNSHVVFDLASKKVLKTTARELKIDSCVIKCKEHLEQIVIAFAKIEELIQSGIKPKDIALVLPDESIANVVANFDKYNNINFAMGKSYRLHDSFIVLQQLQNYLKGNLQAKEYLNRLAIDTAIIDINKPIQTDSFFNTLKLLNLPLYSSEELEKELEKLKLSRVFFKFVTIFKEHKFKFDEWLFLWINQIKEHTLDDVGSGEVTALGVLETRGIDFEGVVIIDFNDNIVPSISNKDRFLNSAVREHAKLPTKKDRENLQKHYYAQLLDGAKKSFIIYQHNSELAPSRFIKELGLKEANEYLTPLEIFYKKECSFIKDAHKIDYKIEFNAKDFVWSNARLKSFLECKRKFYYKYYKKLQEPKNSEINDGLILHAVLSKVLKEGSSPKNLQELKKSFLIELASEYQTLQMEFKTGLWSIMLNNFFENQIEHFKQGWQIEKCEHLLSGEINGLKFSGRVDRIDKKDNQMLVIDYKSGSTKALNSAKSDNLVDFQMNIYDKLLKTLNIKSDFAYIEILNDANLEYLKAQEEKEAKLIEHIEYIKTLKSFEASRCDNLQLCRNCAYRLLCHRGEYL